jgi:two-component system, chemotaxis family, CheB/CheR fusion protein
MSEPIVSIPDAGGEPSRQPLFPVVGIAASAGGLEPLRRILAGLPESSACAYVVVMHLDPNRESRLTDVLQRETKMPVVQAVDGQRVEQDHVYVIPPANYLEIDKGRLVLSAIKHRPPVPMAADKFLASLALDRRDHAVGIVLSGADGDGAIGVKAIKAEGGLVIAQAPESAAHPGMPRNALATGIVDHLLTADRIPQVLLHHIRHLAQVAPLTPQPHHAPSLAEILTIVRNRTELDFQGYKEPMLFRRVQRRMGMSHIPDMAQYIELLGSSSDEARLLASSFLIGVTEFFREPDAWGPLADEVLPNLLSKKPRDEALRVWVPACSTGEEAYSLGMLLLEQPLMRERALHLQLFATDVDTEALKIARAGIYPASIAAAVGPNRLRRFFVKQGADYQVRKELRESVVFAPQNVITDPPFSHIDLISCRNLMIYLGAEAQRRVLELFHFALEPGGCLFLGKSENVGANSTLFEPISQASRLYRSVGTARLAPRTMISSATSLSLPSTTHRDYGKLIRSALLESSVPAAVLTNASHQALYFYGPVDSFLTVRDGEPTADLLTLVRHGLRGSLADALRTCVAERRRVSEVAVLSGEGGERRVSIDVHPVDGDADAPLMLATFTFCGAEAPAYLGEGDAAMQAMEVRLNSSKRDRQRVIEELENTNEALRVANEEALSMNEELQSTNEELETSKEELQSVNEELVTVNSELQENLRALEVANNDLNNLLASTHIPTVFLDRELRIKRFTAPATRLFNLIASDVGRPLCDITGHSDMNTLLHDVRAVLADLAPVEREVESDSGEHYLRRVLPYRTTDDRIEGVVVTFVDVTAMRRSAERERRLAAVMQSSHDAVLIFDFEGKLFGWNRGAEALYGYDSEQALKMNVSVLIPDAAREAQRQAMERVRQGADLIDFASSRRTRAGAIVHVSVTASLLRDETDRPIAIATTERDVTERILAETKLRESEQRFRLLADSAPVMIWMSDLEGTCNSSIRSTSARPAAVRLSPWGVPGTRACIRTICSSRPLHSGVPSSSAIDSTASCVCCTSTLSIAGPSWSPCHARPMTDCPLDSSDP